MAKKTYTFLMTSNRKSQTKAVTISSSVFKIGLGIFIFAFLVGVAVFVDYTGLLLQAGENKRLQAENAKLKMQFEIVENKVNSLENSLERVKSFSTKLRLITDVDGEDRAMNLSLGAKSQSVQKNLNKDNLESEDRYPANAAGANEEEAFAPETPVEDKKGEVVRIDLNDYSSLSLRVTQELKRTVLQEQSVIDLYKKLSDQKGLAKSLPTVQPIAGGWYTAKFGYHMDPFSGKPEMHYGVDIAAPEGTPVLAPADGVVSHIGFEEKLGKVLTIDHGYGIKTRYAHNSQINVELGQKVSRKDVIANVGNTGKSQGPHVYYEVRVNGVPVDPQSYIVNSESN